MGWASCLPENIDNGQDARSTKMPVPQQDARSTTRCPFQKFIPLQD
ncbi:MAG: hypothetical protein F6K44_21280 [Moorea sp. SIO3E2]|nr:hypothetical protein [Moorena sp. SIO3E2]NER85739.1 hypothetical protein [Moorena sp. SIO3A2]